MNAEQITAWGAATAAVLTACTPLVLKVLDWMDRRRQARATVQVTGVTIPTQRTRGSLPAVPARRRR